MIKYSLIFWFFFIGFSSCHQEGSSDKDLEKNFSENSSNLKRDVAYTNPVLNQNFPDPAVTHTPDGYYYAYSTNTSIDNKILNIQASRSKDLIHWEEPENVLPKSPSWADKDFWAPHVLYDKGTQLFYLYYSAESKSKSQGKCLGVATSTSPSGPFKDKGEPLICGEGFVNIDPMAFDDPQTGKKMLYWGSGFEAIKVQELADNRLNFKEGSKPVELIQPIQDDDSENYQKLVEGVWVAYRNGFYYLYYSGDNCCGDNAHYATMVARAKKATGPFETLAEVNGGKNSVILKRNEKWNAPGHNSVITDDANQDWIIYHAIDRKDKSKGRVMLIDKMTYKEGWPVIKTGSPSVKIRSIPIVE